MSPERRRAISTPGERVDPARRGPASAAVSVAIHVVAIAVLVRIAIEPFRLGEQTPRAEPAAPAHVDFVRTDIDTGSRRRAGGDNRRVTNNPAPAPITAPAAVPSELPPEPAKNAPPAAPADGGTGPVVGGGGPTKGVVPAFMDARIWAPSQPLPVKPKTPTERLDSAIAARVHQFEDSLNALGPQRAPGDWTLNGKNGKKYGIDQKYIHLGNFSIPTALLALLPLNVQGNPTTYADAKRLGMIRGEILEQEARAGRDADFNEAVKELRDRKQKERAEKAKEDQTLPFAPPPPKIVP